MIEAGLGGRYDATQRDRRARDGADERRPRAHALAGADGARHRRGEARGARARARRSCSGRSLHADALAVAERVAREQGARLLIAPPRPSAPELAAAGEFQQRNFALARARRRARSCASSGSSRGRRRCARRPRSTPVRGRLQRVAGDPPTVLDGAHNPDAARALAASLPALLDGRPLALVLGVLEDKDAVGMLAALLPLCERAWFTAPPSARALPPATLQSLARQLGFERVECEPSAGARARAGAGVGAAARLRWCSRRARSTSSASCSSRVERRGREKHGVGRAPAKGSGVNDDGPSVLDDDRRRGADRRARDPRVLRGRLRLRPPVSLSSARRCHPSHTSGSKAAG